MRIGAHYLAAALVLVSAATSCMQARASSPVALRDGWRLQSSCKASEGGELISSTNFEPRGWYEISVPSTVLSGQVATGEFKDPYFGMNLRKIPGTTYPIGENFSNLPMPDDSPYHCSWWYRKSFSISATDHAKTIWLRFGGINYRANIWVNGKLLADSKQVAGAYRTYEFDITSLARTGKSNVVAVETFAPAPTDLGVNWVDWNPCPPDKDMGLIGPVSIATSGDVSLRSPMVTTHFSSQTLAEAGLTVYAELHNSADHAVHGIVTGTVAGKPIRQEVDLKPGEDHEVVFSPESYSQLRIHSPRVWWPYQMGTPDLETLSLQFVEQGQISDAQSIRFGIREIKSELTDKGFRLFRINGKPILIRGAGWSQDMLLRESSERLAQQFHLVRDMHLNTIRLEGKLETDEFYRLADEQGILVMAGWCCCDHWEHWDKWDTTTLEVAKASLRAQMLRVRFHPSLMVWLNGSDGPPPANVESAYLAIEDETHWPNPILSSASATPTNVSGKSGVKMTGPYDYVAPHYWLTDTSRYGGAYGFNTETSPGPAIPTVNGLRKFIPEESIWPPNDTWSYHNGGEGFTKLSAFDSAMKASYGPTDSVGSYSMIAQTMAYDGERAMFEAYGRNKYTSTGVIQWMLNNAWPSMIWHLYDYYLETGGGYFGAKKACEPLHIQYAYADRSISIVNSRYQPATDLKATILLYDQDLKELFSKEIAAKIDSDSSVNVLTLPDSLFAGQSKVYFVRLALSSTDQGVISSNFYWVPTQATQFDWDKTDYTHTPAKSHEDLTALRSLKGSSVVATATVSHLGDGKMVSLRLHNPSKALAFQVTAQALDGEGHMITSILWSDNYLELMPDETRVITAPFPAGSPSLASVRMSGWNIPEKTIVPVHK